MAQAFTLQFVHRLNDDETIDSICRDCFITIATAVSETDLKGEERKHHCDPSLLDRYIRNTRHSENFSHRGATLPAPNCCEKSTSPLSDIV
jgi:hypothetical protein